MSRTSASSHLALKMHARCMPVCRTCLEHAPNLRHLLTSSPLLPLLSPLLPDPHAYSSLRDAPSQSPAWHSPRRCHALPSPNRSSHTTATVTAPSSTLDRSRASIRGRCCCPHRRADTGVRRTDGSPQDRRETEEGVGGLVLLLRCIVATGLVCGALGQRPESLCESAPPVR